MKIKGWEFDMIGKRVFGVLGFWLAAITMVAAQSQTSFQVSNVGFSAYTIDGVSNPTLTLYRGVTYTFQVSTPGHPFWIKTMQTTGTGNPYSSGVTGNGSTTGDVVFTVPMNAPDQLYYICEFHSSMTGVFQIETVALKTDEDPAYPKEIALLSSYPNPFNPATTIQFELPQAMDIRVTIYDLLGQHIATLVEGTMEPGYHRVMWDGRDHVGRNVPSGVYVTKLVTPVTTQITRLVLLK
jgi:hypothetical protein